MMVRVNSSGVEDDYLAGLNECFGTWGGPAEFRWALQRSFQGHPPDLLTIDADGQRIAGSAVSYRPLTLASGRQVLVGIMTGSWTRPAARGKGCFTRFIEASVDCVRARRGALLLAFVTETNASYRRLATAGAGLLPTRYVIATPDAEQAAARQDQHPPVEPVPDDTPTWEVMLEQRQSDRAGRTTFGYPDAAHLRAQLGRNGLARLVRVGDMGFAVVEEHGDTDRLQALLPAKGVARHDLAATLVRRALGRGRKAFLFESDPSVAERLCAAEPCVAMPGYLTALVATGEALVEVMGLPSVPTSTALADPASPAWLGPLAIDGGDRM